MKNEEGVKNKLRRGGVFIFVTALHILMLFFIAFTIEVTAESQEIGANVMKLADIEEEKPAPLPSPEPEPPPPPLKERPPVELIVNEPVAETIIETEETPVELAAAPESPSLFPQPSPVTAGTGRAARYTGEYLPQNKVSVLPRLDEREIRSKLIYPSIALRSGLEGTVYLELYIDSEGQVRRIVILKENPPGRGFGEAAAKAFEGLRGKPAEANGEAVAVRYRYPVRFQIK
ncbi:MAG: TonB family protein [Spirochaetaceae bacterium]|nr:TonB family protein [Spirochaetaceae bacterium]